MFSLIFSLDKTEGWYHYSEFKTIAKEISAFNNVPIKI
jgi:hypothetical protein